MNWYIGQRIVAIRNHSQGDFKVGDEFTVKGLREGCCIYNPVHLSIGLPAPFGNVCSTCGAEDEDRIGWYNQISFSPIEEIPASHEEQIKELLTIKEPQKI